MLILGRQIILTWLMCEMYNVDVYALNTFSINKALIISLLQKQTFEKDKNLEHFKK